VTYLEIVFLLANALLVAGVLLKLLRAPNPMLFWSPLLFFTLTWAYYAVCGPLYYLWRGDLFDRGQDMRPYLLSASIGGLVFFTSVLVGYRLARGFRAHVPLRLRHSAGWYSPETGRHLMIIGIGMMLIGSVLFSVVAGRSFGSMLNPLGMTEEKLAEQGYAGAFANYFGYGIQLFVPGCILLTLAVRRYRRAWPAFVLSLVVTISIYLTMAFRYRLLLVFCGMAAAYYLDRWRRPSAVFVLGWGMVSVVLMGVIGATRNYGLGLRLDRLREGSAFENMMSAGMGDAGIFMSSGAVLDVVPAQVPHARMAALKSALLLPVPSALYPAKNSDQYAQDVLATIYGREYVAGAVYMFFAEWYYAYGWVGLISASLVLGFLLGRLWTWFLRRSDNLFAIVLYSCLLPFSYVVLSRGYFAQVVMLFAFAALPGYLAYRWGAWERHISRFIRWRPRIVSLPDQHLDRR
jgi:oligosaccharide repeat unit polymerase